MGKVIRQLEFNNKDEMQKYLKNEFDFYILLKEGESNYPDQELKSILVNLDIEYEKDKLKLNITKLVTLKAFLLSKEQDMDIVDLVFNIDNIMGISKQGLRKSQEGILDNENLKEFLTMSNIKIDLVTKEKVFLSDNKRQVSIEYKDCFYKFNTIKLTEELKK